jgi:hypothetical protein
MELHADVILAIAVQAVIFIRYITKLEAGLEKLTEKFSEAKTVIDTTAENLQHHDRRIHDIEVGYERRVTKVTT